MRGSSSAKALWTGSNGKVGMPIRIYYHQPGVKTWWTMRRAAFAAGFRDYLEKSQPVEDLPSISQLIRGEFSSALSEPT